MIKIWPLSSHSLPSSELLNSQELQAYHPIKGKVFSTNQTLNEGNTFLGVSKTSKHY